jgi:hypothetical protein
MEVIVVYQFTLFVWIFKTCWYKRCRHAFTPVRLAMPAPHAHTVGPDVLVCWGGGMSMALGHREENLVYSGLQISPAGVQRGISVGATYANFIVLVLPDCGDNWQVLPHQRQLRYWHRGFVCSLHGAPR